MKLLFELLKFNNSTVGNRLLLTTHSPYILNYLSIAVKAGNVLSSLKDKSAKQQVGLVVPESSAVASDSLYIYECNADGTIKRLEDYNGIPSDENHLNEILAETNELFDRLLEIEEEAND